MSHHQGRMYYKSDVTFVCTLLLYIYIYIYIYMYIYRQHFFIDTYLIEHNRLFSTYFFVNPFELPYWSYDIRRELVDKSSIISYFPRTFYPTLSHHQGRMYYKSDATFVCTLLLYIYIYIYIYMGSIFSLIHIWLNINFFLPIFLLILSNCHIDFMIFGGNWLINLP